MHEKTEGKETYKYFGKKSTSSFSRGTQALLHFNNPVTKEPFETLDLQLSQSHVHACRKTKFLIFQMDISLVREFVK